MMLVYRFEIVEGTNLTKMRLTLQYPADYFPFDKGNIGTVCKEAEFIIFKIC